MTTTRSRAATMLWGLALAALCAPPAGGQDIAGASDHPLITRYEGSTIIRYERKDFDTLLVPTEGTVYRDNAFRFPISFDPEGRVTRIQYKAPVGRSSLEVFRNYENALLAADVQVLFSCIKAACGEADTFAQTLFGTTTPPLTLNSKSQAYLTGKLTRAAGDVYIRLFVVENEEWASMAGTEKGQTVVQLDVIETQPMQGGKVAVNAVGMSKAISATGRVSLYGIYFDSGRAEMKPESRSALDEIAKLLRNEPALRVLVVGHTDNAGSFESNQDLSRQRAQAVVQELVSAHGIAAARLTLIGVGFAAPVDTNRSEEGRWKNRRVELVEY